MANTGIILRKKNKTYFDDHPPVQGEMVFSTDTDEIGVLKDGNLFWQPWEIINSDIPLKSGDQIPNDSNGEDGDKYIYLDDSSSNVVLREYIKESGSWVEIHWGKTLSWILDTFEEDINDFLGQRGDYKMAAGYTPVSPYDVVTKEYLDSKLTSGNFIKLDGSDSMDSGYLATADHDVMTGASFLQDGLTYIVPDTDPQWEGALWNDNGVLKISTTPRPPFPQQ